MYNDFYLLFEVNVQSRRKFEHLIRKYGNYCLDPDSFINYILELCNFKFLNKVTSLILLNESFDEGVKFYCFWNSKIAGIFMNMGLFLQSGWGNIYVLLID